MKSKITYAIDLYENGQTGDKVQGITVMVESELQKTFEKIMAGNPKKYPNYVDVLNDVIFKGLAVFEKDRE